MSDAVRPGVAFIRFLQCHMDQAGAQGLLYLVTWEMRMPSRLAVFKKKLRPANLMQSFMLVCCSVDAYSEGHCVGSCVHACYQS
jgi:hypothetical protein